jgi:hypothetical protein
VADDLADDLAVLGVQLSDPSAAEFLAQITPAVRKTHFEIYPENQTALELFLAVQTNWRLVAGMDGVTFQGIDYTALTAVFTLMAIPKKQRPALFAELRTMEGAAIPILNKRK